MDTSLEINPTHHPPLESSVSISSRPSHRRCRTALTKPFECPDSTLDVLRRRLEETEENCRREAEEYRALIAEMATTCRTLQARIRVLEAEHNSLESEARKRRNESRRRTWQSPEFGVSSPQSPTDTASSGSLSPNLGPLCDQSINHCQCQQRLRGLGMNYTLLGPTPEPILRYDDEALLWKAWSWY